jgi:hypothetical protein
MKRILIMLLIACSAITTASADSTATPQKKAKSVIESLEGIIAFYAEKGSQTLSVTKNPETGLIEASEHITPFTCQKEDLWTIPIGFNEDEPLSYQYMHLLPGNTELFNLKVVTNNGQKSKDVCIRTNSKQEMWFMCCKNPDNPMLRDAYAIVWEETKDKNVAGTVYMITSLRPDLYTKNQETAKNTFRIDGRVGYDLTDSLYVVYMADTSEELDKQADDAFIAYMPVKNKRFSFSVEIDKPKVGRIRTVMPDGSLCHLWTNLDFVPGETYQITTHNGYYDEDRDYERRVGRYSGRSLLNNRQVRGIDDVSIDTVATEAVFPEPSPILKMRMEMKCKALETKIEAVKTLYRSLDPKNNVSWVRKGLIFDRISKQNKEVDADFRDLQDLFKDYFKEFDNLVGKRAEILGKGYAELLEFYTEQNKGLTEMMSSGIQLPKSAQKTQKALNKYIEKYMTEMTKLIE